MAKAKPYRILVEISFKSKARFFNFIPVKSIISGETFDLYFRFRNMSEESFPGTAFLFKIVWETGQTSRTDFEIPPLKENGTHEHLASDFYALGETTGLLIITHPHNIKDKQGNPRNVEFYRGERQDGKIEHGEATIALKAKRWEEVYEFWAMIISATGLIIIALEKIFSFLNWLKP